MYYNFVNSVTIANNQFLINTLINMQHFMQYYIIMYLDYDIESFKSKSLIAIIISIDLHKFQVL